MRKIYITLILFLGFIKINAQNQNNSHLPNITPPSPESFKFSEYGKNSANEFTGKINLNIPIYNFQSGNLNLPISLSYSGAGVKVDDMSTQVGTNWILNTGGVINRVINDGPDENIFPVRQFINYNQMSTDAIENCRPNSQYFIEISEFNEQYDTEIDIWNFNFNGNSGSFYLDENFNPVYIENENEFRIEITGNGTTNAEKLRNSYTFIITTSDGVKYYFGGNECEKTMIFSGHRGTSYLSNTSFYLYKIVHPVNGEIIIEYNTDQAALLKHGKSYTMKSVCGGFTAYHIPSVTSIGSLNQINNPKTIKKIKSNITSEEIIFNSDYYNNFDYLSSLNNIEIFNNNTLVRKVNFTYDFPNNISTEWGQSFPASRFFLTKVEIVNGSQSNSNLNEIYEFEYDNISAMPQRLSASQDLLGYFNNKANITTIPKPSYFNNVANNSFGDLNPDFQFAKRGSLVKIKYPTRGFSVFEYEPIKAKKEIFNNYELFVEGTSIAQIPGDNGIAEGNVSFLGVYENQNVLINISTGINEIEGQDTEIIYQVFHNARVELKITDLTDASIQPKIIYKQFGMQQGVSVANHDFKKGHQYQISLKILNSNTTNQFAPYINCNVNFQIFNGYEAIDGFGVRLKSQKDYNNDNSFSNYKRYFYRSINEINENISKLNLINFNPKYTVDFNSNESCFFSYDITLYSSPSDIYKNRDLIETYSVVTTSYGGDNFENGGTEKSFFKTPNEANQKLVTVNDGCWIGSSNEIECGAPNIKNTGITVVRNLSYTEETTKMDYFNGKLLLERNFIKKDNNLFKNKEIFYDYFINRKSLNNAVNFIGRALYGYCNELNFCPNDINTPIKALSDCFMAYYFIETFSFKLNNVITKNYIEPVPLSQNVPYFSDSEQAITENYNLHDLNFKKLITTENYTYGSLKGLPTEITTTTSESGVVNRTVNTYVNTANSLSGINSNQIPLYTSLISQNRVGSPVQTQQFKNSELVSTQRTLYNNFTVNNVTKILPEKIQIAKGSQTLEDKALFYNYDEHFNPVVMGYKDAPKTRYLFNTEGLVVAKIENYTGTATTFPLVIGNIDNTSCALQTQNPNSLVTVYQYNLNTKKVVKVTDPNCRDTYYEYDDLQHLKWIKDHEGNIVKEFDQQFKPQN